MKTLKNKKEETKENKKQKKENREHKEMFGEPKTEEERLKIAKKSK